MITLNNKVYEVDIEEVTESTGEEEATITQISSLDKSNNLAKCSSVANVESPMTGNILDISVKVGEKVKKDQVLIMLEAMKMENEIVSPSDGKIISIDVKNGDSVYAGQELIKIE